MERRSFFKATGTIATGSLATLAGCAGGDGGGSTPTANPAETNSIAMVTDGGDYYFDPIGLFVESGETITWEIESGAHSSTAYKEGTEPASVTRVPDSAEGWNSETLSESGAAFEHTFEVAGTYDYFCIPHKSLGMVGRIVVDEPGGPAEGSMPPDGDVPESQTIVDQRTVTFDEFSG
jgi:plastocyanin